MIRAVAGLVVVMVLSGCTARSADPDRPPVRPTTQTDDTTGVLAGRAAHTSTAMADGHLLVAGGCDVDGCSSATASAFVVSGASAVRVADLSEARDAHTAVALADGRVLVVGGFAEEGRPPLSSAELYDPVRDDWTPTGSLGLGRGGHAAALLGDGRVLVVGGWVGPSTYTDTTEIYDPRTGEFTPGPRLPAAADGLAAAPLPDGCVLVVGGQIRSQVPTGSAATICPDAKLRTVGSLATARFKHGIAPLGSGQVLVIGGTPDDDELLTSTEIYDPTTQRFLPGPELSSGRYKMSDSVVVLPDDRVIAAGGGAGVELIDIDSDRSTPLVEFGGGRQSFSTAGITGRRLVVIGGYDESIRLTHTYATLPLDDVRG